jgi:hypothetical protein
MQGEIPVRLEGTSELAIGRLARYYGAPVQGRSATLYLGTCLLTLESTRLPRTDCGGHQGQAGQLETEHAHAVVMFAVCVSLT